MLPEAYTPEMLEIVDRYEGTGANLHFVLEGYPIPGTDSSADGITIQHKDGRKDVYLQVVSETGLVGRSEHELGHVVMFDDADIK